MADPQVMCRVDGGSATYRTSHRESSVSSARVSVLSPHRAMSIGRMKAACAGASTARLPGPQGCCRRLSVLIEIVRPRLSAHYPTERGNMSGGSAWVLSGGGTKGAIEVGAVLFLDQILGLRPSALIGVSVGAINSFKIAEGRKWSLVDDPEPALEPDRGVLGLAAIWRGLRSRADMVELFSDTHVIMRFISEEHNFYPLFSNFFFPFFIIDAIHIVPDLLELKPKIERTLNRDSIGNLAPMEKMMRDPTRLSMTRVEDNRIVVEVGFVAQNSGALQFARFNKREADLFLPDGQMLASSVAPFYKAVLGAAAIPIAFAPQEIHGDWVVDGGVRNVTPIGRAVTRGADRIYAVTAPGWSTPGDVLAPQALLEAGFVNVTEDLSPPRLIRRGYRSIDELLYDELSRWETTPQSDWPGVVFSIVPEFDAISTAEVDPGKIDIAMSYGCALATAQLDPRIRSNTARKFLRDLETDIALLRSIALRNQRTAVIGVEIRVADFVIWKVREDYSAKVPVNQYCEEVWKALRGVLEHSASLAAAAVSLRGQFNIVQEPPGIAPVSMTDAGWGRFPVDRVEPNDADNDYLDDVTRKAVNAARVNLAARHIVIAPSEQRLTESQFHALSTWRNGSGPLVQTWWGSLSSEFGRTPSVLLGARNPDSYPLPTRGPWNNQFKKSPRVHYGQRLDLVIASADAVHRLRRPLAASSDEPWTPSLVWSSTDGESPTSVQLVQQHLHGEVPGRCLVAICLRPPALLHPTHVILRYSQGPGDSWSDYGGLNLGVTGEIAMLAVDDGQSLATDIFAPFGPGLIHYRAYSGITRERSDFSQIGGLALPEPFAETWVIDAISACQTNRDSVRLRGGAIELILVVRHTVTGESILMTTSSAPNDSNWTEPAVMTDSVSHRHIWGTGTPGFMQNANGTYELIVYAEQLVHYRRGRHQSEWRPVAEILPLESPAPVTMTSIGMCQIDDGTPRTITASLCQSPWAFDASQPMMATLNADDTWSLAPDVRIMTTSAAL